jgi:hypothetical protein
MAAPSTESSDASLASSVSDAFFGSTTIATCKALASSAACSEVSAFTLSRNGVWA